MTLQRNVVSSVMALFSAIFVAYAGGIVASAQNASTGKTVWDGVYSAAQATRGKKLYTQSCGECHMDNLQGDSADIPSLVGPDFMLQWADLTVDELLQRIRTTMPQDSPSSLSAQTYVDIVAYILESNKFPAGKEELKRDADVLKAIKITKGKY